MKKLLNFVAIVIAAAVVHLPAMAAPVLNQNNPETSGSDAFCFIYTSALCGQSFKQDASTISGAGIYFSPYYAHAAGTLTISIFSQYGGVPSGLIATGSMSYGENFGGWADVFWTPAAVNMANQYYMVLSSTEGDSTVNYSYSAYNNGNALFAGAATQWSEYDLVFRTYADDSSAEAVPEPGSFALLGLGLAALGFAARKKRS